MPTLVGDELESAVRDAERQYHRLVVLVGPSRSGKTPALRELSQRFGAPLVNVNLTLSERMLDLPLQRRPLLVQDGLDTIIAGNESTVVVLDNTETLFDTALKQDPLRLLQRMSRHRVIVASWLGHVDGSDLVYAEPGHPEYRRYPKPDANIVATGHAA